MFVNDTLRVRWIKRRNALISSARFQRFAASFPLTRPVAAKRARTMFNTVAGFVYSQILRACIALDLFEMLRDEPHAVESLAQRCALPTASMLTLLKAAESLRLVESLPDGRYALGGDGAALLGNPGIAEMIAHHDALYADLADPVALLRRGGGGGHLAGYWPYEQGDSEAAARYSALMAASQPMIAEQVIRAYPFARHRHVLDIGGGEGAFLERVAAHCPDLTLSLFDLPPVAERARARLGVRVNVTGGSFVDDPLPQGADLVTLVRILHDHDDDRAQALLVSIAASLNVGDTLLVAEPMAATTGAEAMGHGYFGLYLLAMGSGRPRTAGEIGSMMQRAGFTAVREVRTDMPITCRILVARK
jgi:demethylspheroidene O-methyltransferase